MQDSDIRDIPKMHTALMRERSAIGFSMPSDLYIGTLLKTLISSKPNARVLELGTGIGLSLSWMIDGLSDDSELITIDNDAQLSRIAASYFGNDNRVSVVCEDASHWIQKYKGDSFDLIFADAWPGKYSDIDAILKLVKIGGFYIIDDMAAQPNWPKGHQHNVDDLMLYLEGRDDFNLTKMNWSTGIVIAVRKS